MRDALPKIPVPLLAGDGDVWLDLQSAFDAVYHRARYDLSIDYAQALIPPLGEADAPGAARLLGGGR